MSYGIMPFSVKIEQLQKAVGSKDAALAARLKARLEDLVEEFDSGDEEEPTINDAIDDLINGAELRKGYGHLYGYVVEGMCWEMGKMLDNDELGGMNADWSEELNQAMQDGGVSEEILSLTGHLMYRRSPVEIPEPDDFPFIGYLTKAEIPAALAAMKQANFEEASDDVRRAMVELQEWLEACGKESSDLVCFYH
jgi:hypothetical protein